MSVEESPSLLEVRMGQVGVSTFHKEVTPLPTPELAAGSINCSSAGLQSLVTFMRFGTLFDLVCSCKPVSQTAPWSVPVPG